jgi:hypothetical protein
MGRFHFFRHGNKNIKEFTVKEYFPIKKNKTYSGTPDRSTYIFYINCYLLIVACIIIHHITSFHSIPLVLVPPTKHPSP